MNTQELNLTNLGLVEIDEQELTKVNGGWIMVAFGVLGGVCLLAYGAGYVYGKLTCDN